MPNAPLQIADATHEDLDLLVPLSIAVQTLHAEGRPDLFRAADPSALRGFLRDRLESGALVLVARRDSSSVDGYVLAEILDRPQTPFQYLRKSVYVHQIAVAPEARRGGIGSLLLEEVAQRARDEGATSIRLDSWAFNTTAHTFFEAQGFQTSQIVFERPVAP